MHAGNYPPLTSPMRRSGMTTAVTISLTYNSTHAALEAERRLRRVFDDLEVEDAEHRRRARGLPSYTEARWATPAKPRAPRREAREPAQFERATARRTDREPGRRRARSRDYARTGRCSRRPAP